MKIDASNPFPETQPPVPKRPTGSGAQEVAGSPESDKANLASSSLVSQLAAKIKQLPDIRQERVAALQKAIQNGEYQVSDQQIADAVGPHLFGKGSSK
jgi:flagellar biosynthesis anti-sigma factor FlgM